jgi:hypothetical protein
MPHHATLIHVLIGEKNITEQMYEWYGPHETWKQKELRYRDFMTDEDVGKVIEVKWRQSNQRIDTFLFRIQNIDCEFRHDLFFPFQPICKWVKTF